MATTLEPVLAKHPFFQGLEPEYLKLIVGCAANVLFQPGQVIFRADDEVDRFYLIRRGHVAIELYAPPRGTITIQTLGEGDILGWSWLIPPHRPRLARHDRADTRDWHGWPVSSHEVRSRPPPGI